MKTTLAIFFALTTTLVGQTYTPRGGAGSATVTGPRYGNGDTGAGDTAETVAQAAGLISGGTGTLNLSGYTLTLPAIPESGVTNLVTDLAARVVNGTNSGAVSIASTGAFTLTSSVNLIEQRNGTSAQGFRMYNTYTDASNYERGRIMFSGNELFVGTENAGTGTARAVKLQAAGLLFFGSSGNVQWYVSSTGHVMPATDNTTDMGASGSRVRSAYIGTSIYSNGITVYSATLTATGTTGAQTINKPMGRVNIAAGQSSVVVTNSLCTGATTPVNAWLATNDATARIANIARTSGSFTINLTAAATAETELDFLVYGTQ